MSHPSADPSDSPERLNFPGQPRSSDQVPAARAFFWYLVAFGCLLGTYLLLVPSVWRESPPAWLALAWLPSGAALLTAWRLRGSVSAIGRRTVRKRYFAAALALPVICATSVYGLLWASGLAPLQPLTSLDALANFISRAALGWILAALAAAGQEIGWRGFLYPRLPPRQTAVRVWLLWALGLLNQLPLVLSAGSDIFRGVILAGAAGFALTVILVWFRARSGSFWPGLVFQTVNLGMIFALLQPLTLKPSAGPVWAGEQGLALTGAYLALAVGFFLALPRTDLPADRPDATQSPARQ